MKRENNANDFSPSGKKENQAAEASNNEHKSFWHRGVQIKYIWGMLLHTNYMYIEGNI